MDHSTSYGSRCRLWHRVDRRGAGVCSPDADRKRRTRLRHCVQAVALCWGEPRADAQPKPSGPAGPTSTLSCSRSSLPPTARGSLSGGPLFFVPAVVFSLTGSADSVRLTITSDEHTEPSQTETHPEKPTRGMCCRGAGVGYQETQHFQVA